VQAGGANIDTAGFDISVAMPFSHDAALGANVDGGLIKNGLGALTLGGVNTYTGDTIVNEGALIVNGSLGSAVTVNSGAILGGSGNIAGAAALASGAMLAPGASVGTLTFSGPGGLDVSSAIGGTNVGALVFELVAPASSDQISLAGPLTIGAGALEFNDFSFLTLAGFGAGTYTLIDTTNAISGTLGSGLSGTVGGLDATLGLANGQDIVLNVVPEPATWGLAGIGAFLAICGLRRRRVACRE